MYIGTRVSALLPRQELGQDAWTLGALQKRRTARVCRRGGLTSSGVSLLIIIFLIKGGTVRSCRRPAKLWGSMGCRQAYRGPVTCACSRCKAWERETFHFAI